MKKATIALLALLTVTTLAGCGKTETPPGETTAQTTTAASTPTSTAEETTAETETVYPTVITSAYGFLLMRRSRSTTLHQI